MDSDWAHCLVWLCVIVANVCRYLYWSEHLVIGQLGHGAKYVPDLSNIANRSQAVRDCLSVPAVGMQPQHIRGGDVMGQKVNSCIIGSRG